MTAMTPAERQAARRERKRKKGLVRRELFVLPSRTDELAAIEADLQQPRKKTGQPEPETAA